ncbi:CPBP family intramembrane glutamic endopeptidase [Gillisia hiemivivida]|uniref:CPBP family intramembrane metalloprotease n=1 Tax=Gillisia hiemivivida TaxID=291190 RepID=A0A5C6ZVV1_9FLAO|nr:CPBP family intramembrane glutamic endopeptidase [Gillisia hiemivivida]TXD94484.1 CPBP family intramembrane metalloprotease [Gillisia hiemivivida]
MLGSYFVFFAFLGILQAVFPNLDFIKYQQSDLNALMSENPWKFVLLAVVIAPVLEEGMFRSLIKPSPNEFIFFLCSWILVGAAILIPVDVHWTLKFGFLLLFITLIYFFLKELIPRAFQYKACSFLNRNYISIWMITSVIFGLVHISNYVDGFRLDFLLFLMIVPRIIAGFYFGKVKVENKSMIWPIAMHAMNNATVVVFLIPKMI